MEIKRGRYVLRSDKWCYWIDEEYVGKKGTLVTKNVSGYYPDIKQLANGLARHTIGETESTSMKKLIEDVRKIHEKVETMTYKKAEQISKD